MTTSRFGTALGESVRDLIAATELGSRMAARGCRDQRLDDATIRRVIDRQYRSIFESEGFDDKEIDGLRDAVARGIDAALAG